MDKKMNSYHNHITNLIDNNDDSAILETLKKLYKILKAYNNQQRKYWVKYYLFPQFIDCILTRNLLGKMDWEIRRFYDIQIMIISPSPSIYREKY